jgi:arginine deiminase
VRDDFEKDQTRMHLDCIFNIVSDNVVLLAEARSAECLL